MIRAHRVVPFLVLGSILFGTLASPWAEANTLREAQALYHQGQYFKAARYAFAAKDANPRIQADAYAWVTMSLVGAGLYNSASYFFIKTLQSGDRGAIRKVLSVTQDLLVHVGGDVIRKYLIRHTKYEDYDSINRSAYLYALGKDALLAGEEEKAVGYFNGVDSQSTVWPFVLQLRGSALAILGKNDPALDDFRNCIIKAASYAESAGADLRRARIMREEAEDLQARCLAGQARTLYQMDRFAEADRVYDYIDKPSIVWPDILFEQAWNAFARQEYNRTLGKLVSYKSPALDFVFNPETDVLRAQAYLALCMYSDANEVINDFNAKYGKIGEEVKKFVEGNASNLPVFYGAGKEAARGTVYSRNAVTRMMNRFVRSPYFQNLIRAEMDAIQEQSAVARFAAMQSGVKNSPGQGFPGFLNKVLEWRVRSVQLLGGAFVKNSLMDYHATLISDFEKMAFIKLEMLKVAKESLVSKKPLVEGRSVGNIEPERKDYQYYWGFNGEFWADELGDYVFGLESQCRGKNGGN